MNECRRKHRTQMKTNKKREHKKDPPEERERGGTDSTGLIGFYQRGEDNRFYTV
jgi:hypothetical protein